MDHDEAVRSKAAERYVARKLPPAEREAFAEHFFDCRKCAARVRFEGIFLANLRAVLLDARSQPDDELSGFLSWKRWLAYLRLRPITSLSFAANFGFAAALGLVLLARSHQPGVPRFTQPFFAPGPTHGGGDVHVLPAGDTAYEVSFPSPGAAARSYSYEIVNAAGRRESSGPLQAPSSGDDLLYLVVPLANLPAGVHTLTVRGGPGGEMVSWSRFSTSHCTSH
jgi:hypothetical protein